MAIDTFSKIDQQLSEPIQQFVTDGVSNLASAVSGPLKAAVTLGSSSRALRSCAAW